MSTFLHVLSGFMTLPGRKKIRPALLGVEPVPAAVRSIDADRYRSSIPLRAECIELLNIGGG